MDAPEVLQPGIKMTVEWLRANGFDVKESGDGKTSVEEDSNIAYASMEVKPSENLVSETRRLVSLLHERGIRISDDLEDDVSPFVYAAFEPALNQAVIDMCNIDDSLMFKMLS